MPIQFPAASRQWATSREEAPRSLAQHRARDLLGCSDSVLLELRKDFRLFGLPHQFVPTDATNHVLWFGGRGAAKSVACSQAIRSDVCRGVRRLALVGRTVDNIRVMIEGPSGLIEAFPESQRPHYNVGKKKVTFHTGAEAVILSVEAGTDEWRGKGFEVAWLDELSTYGDDLEEVWRQTILSARLGNPRLYAASNPQPVNRFLKKLLTEAEERGLTVVPCSSFDNFAHLPEPTRLYIEALARSTLGRCEVFPEFLEIEGALWKESWIRIQPAPDRGTTVIGIDPAGEGRGADEHGIVVARASTDRNGRRVAHVLDDKSFAGPTNAWPKLVAELAKKYGATLLAVEKNRGLTYLRDVIRPHLPSIQIKEVHVSKSKDERALPVAQRYEMAQVFHDHRLEKLEEQLTTWVPSSQDEQRRRHYTTSPGRLDALVHAVTALNLDVMPAPVPRQNIPQPTLRF